MVQPRQSSFGACGTRNNRIVLPCATSSNATIYPLGSRRGRRETAYEPAEQEEDCAGEKNGKTRRVVPGIVDILTDVEQGPK